MCIAISRLDSTNMREPVSYQGAGELDDNCRQHNLPLRRKVLIPLKRPVVPKPRWDALAQLCMAQE
jgi:hypothetical protein